MTKLISALTVAVALTVSALTGCCNNDNSEILKPIDKNLIGSWELTGSCQVDDQGEITEEHGTEGSSFIYRFNENGTVTNVRTIPDGWQELRSHTWKADEAQNGYFLDENFSTLVKLTADEMYFQKESVIKHDPETGKVIEKAAGQFRFMMKRIASEKALGEKLVGKWAFSKTFQKINGEWVEKDYGVSIESWRDFKDNGRVAGYNKKGDLVNEYEVNWKVNVKTGEWCMYEGEKSIAAKIELIDNDTMELYYNENVDHKTGKVTTGEFKDVCIRVK